MVESPNSIVQQNNLKQIRPGSRVVVAMSGGVDSSVAAAILVEDGYEVIGVMMRLWSESDQNLTQKYNRCCTPAQMADARDIARQLQIPFYVLDVQDRFRRTVVESYIVDHTIGHTPNPCITCNREIRFEYLLEYASYLGADYLATGHYANIKKTPSGYALMSGRDKSKDQSYILYILTQEKLARLLFPIGNLTKAEVREIARLFDLPVAAKEESMDLCFVADGDYGRFLKSHAESAFTPGPVVLSSGKQVGLHDGLPNYTIGQRRGLGVAAGQPVYVLAKNVIKNEIVVGPRNELAKTTLFVSDVNWIDGNKPKSPLACTVKIRYKAEPSAAQLTVHEGDKVHVEFSNPVYGVTAGQAAVFYASDQCIGGGIITDDN